jgi:hypothetical protein
MDITDITAQLRSAVDDALARAVAVGGLAGVALIHLLQTPNAFSEAGYLGALFIAAAVTAVLLAAVLTRTGDPRAWLATGGLVALLLLGYAISRSIGLPGFTSDIGEWAEPPGLAALVAESLLLVVSGLALSLRDPVVTGAPEPDRFASSRRVALVMRGVTRQP